MSSNRYWQFVVDAFPDAWSCVLVTEEPSKWMENLSSRIPARKIKIIFLIPDLPRKRRRVSVRFQRICQSRPASRLARDWKSIRDLPLKVWVGCLCCEVLTGGIPGGSCSSLDAMSFGVLGHQGCELQGISFGVPGHQFCELQGISFGVPGHCFWSSGTSVLQVWDIIFGVPGHRFWNSGT